MNNYKFRGKTAAGKWVYGDLIHNIGGGCSIVECYQFTVKSSVDVLPETVGQWTGQVDKNKKEIYQRDICRAWQGNPCCGIYPFDFSGECIFISGGFYIKEKKEGFLINLSEIENIEVLGNIPDNPELLEGK